MKKLIIALCGLLTLSSAQAAIIFTAVAPATAGGAAAAGAVENKLDGRAFTAGAVYSIVPDVSGTFTTVTNTGTANGANFADLYVKNTPAFASYTPAIAVGSEVITFSADIRAIAGDFAPTANPNLWLAPYFRAMRQIPSTFNDADSWNNRRDSSSGNIPGATIVSVGEANATGDWQTISLTFTLPATDISTVANPTTAPLTHFQYGIQARGLVAGQAFDIRNVSITTVPEPSALGLLGLAGLGLARRSRK